MPATETHISKQEEKLQTEIIEWADKIGFMDTYDFGLDGHIMTHIDQRMLNWKIIKVSPCIASEIICMLQPYYFYWYLSGMLWNSERFKMVSMNRKFHTFTK